MLDTSLRYFTQILNGVSEFNVSQEDCLRSAGLKEMPQTNRVKADVLAGILNFSARHLQEPLLGVKCGLRYPVLQYTRPADFLKLCENLDHAAKLYTKYCALFHMVGAPTEIISEGGRDRMIWVSNIDQDQADTYRQFIELIMTNLMTSINWLAWKTPNAVKTINLKHDAIPSRSDYESLFECDVRFGQDEYSLIIRDGVKDAPFAMSNPIELSKVCMRFDLALNEWKKDKSFVDRVELEIRRSVDKNIYTKASVAKALGVPERSMTTTLKNSGETFKDIKTRVLKELAISMIDQGLSLAEVAHTLGYNDQPAFTRAYKRWFGYSPKKHKSMRG